MQPDSKQFADTLRQHFAAFSLSHPPKTLPVGRHKWTYLSCGRGDHVLLLLEGGGAVADIDFQRILEFEASRRVISVGYPVTATNMSDLVTGIAAVMEAEAVQKAVIYGHSLGGAVAQCFARTYPNRVRELVLANIAVASRWRAAMARLLGVLLPVLPSGLLRKLMKAGLARNLATMEAAEREFYTSFFSEMVDQYLTKEFLVNQFRCLLDFLNHYHFDSGDMTKWGGRILILEAADDRGWNVNERAAMRRLYPQAIVHTFAAGGHLVGFTKRREYDSVLREFLGWRC